MVKISTNPIFSKNFDFCQIFNKISILVETFKNFEEFLF